MRFASLGSGSRGNGTLVEAAGTRVLVDCGFSVGQTCERLARLGLRPEMLSAIVVTHEHNDHIGGVGALARRCKLPVYLTPGTLRGARQLGELPEVRLFSAHETFEIGALRVEPFPVPHDACEPAQFVFTDGQWRFGMLTDIGGWTPHVEASLNDCHGLLLECNHDTDMLWQGSYPPSLKQRVGGQHGHLSNVQAAALLGKLSRTRLQHVVAAHLSQENNSPQLARQALAGVLGCKDEWIGVADQEAGLAWRQLGG